MVSVDLPCGRNGDGYPRWRERPYRSFTRRHPTLHLIRANSLAVETVETVRSLTDGNTLDFILIDAYHS